MTSNEGGKKYDAKKMEKIEAKIRETGLTEEVFFPR